MPATNAQQVLNAITDAIALVTFDLGTLPLDAPLGALGEATAHLQRALARLATLTTTHPDLTVADALPAGTLPADEIGEWQAAGRELERLVRLEPLPVHVTLVTGPMPDEAPDAAWLVCEALQGVTVTAHRTGADDRVSIDLGALVADALADAPTLAR